MTDRYDTTGNLEAQTQPGSNGQVLVNKLGVTIVHIEVILIHPFREGNGRLSRLLANIMALQAGWPNLDFSAWDRDKSRYFAAIRAGLDDSAPMQKLVRPVLRESSAVGGS